MVMSLLTLLFLTETKNGFKILSQLMMQVFKVQTTQGVTTHQERWKKLDKGLIAQDVQRRYYQTVGILQSTEIGDIDKEFLAVNYTETQ